MPEQIENRMVVDSDYHIRKTVCLCDQCSGPIYEDDDFYDFLVSGEDSSVELPKEDKVNKSDGNHTSEMLETSEGSHNFDKLHRRL